MPVVTTTLWEDINDALNAAKRLLENVEEVVSSLKALDHWADRLPFGAIPNAIDGGTLVLTPREVDFERITAAVASGAMVLIGYGSSNVAQMKWMRVWGINGPENLTVAPVYDPIHKFDLQKVWRKKPAAFIEAVLTFSKIGA